MSQDQTERADLAIRLYEVWNSAGIGAVADQFWSERIEWRDDPSVPDAATFRGREEVREHIRDRVDVLGHFRIDTERVVDCGGDRVLVVYTVRGEGGQSGVPWNMRMGQLLRFEGDRVVDVQDYLDTAEALEAAGLSE
jgi:ketosteroid isomerase-like protein